MRKRLMFVFSLMVMALLLLTSCGGLISEASPPAANQVAVAEGDTGISPNSEPAQPAEAVPPQVVEDSPPNQGEGTSGEQPVSLPAKPELGFALGQAELKASNPRDVSLDSGRLQLVEMFAFW